MTNLDDALPSMSLARLAVASGFALALSFVVPLVGCASQGDPKEEMSASHSSLLGDECAWLGEAECGKVAGCEGSLSNGCSGATCSEWDGCHACDPLPDSFFVCRAVLPPPPPPPPCVRSGCRGEICSDLPQGNEDGSCPLRPASDACIAEALCERQQSGACGWSIAPATVRCAENDGVPKAR